MAMQTIDFLPIKHARYVGLGAWLPPAGGDLQPRNVLLPPPAEGGRHPKLGGTGRCLGTSKPIQNHKHLEVPLYFTLISLSSCRFEQFSVRWALKTRQDPPTELALSEETDVNQVGFVIAHSQFCGERADMMVLNSRKSCRAMSQHLSNQATIACASGTSVPVSQRVSGDRLVSQKGLLLICHSLSQSGASNLSLNSHLDAFFFFNTLMKLSGA